MERVVDLAQSAMQHIKSVAEASNDAGMEGGSKGGGGERERERERGDTLNLRTGMLDSSSQFTLEAILAGMHYYRCHDYLELVALINLLPDFIATHTKVHNKLDSIDLYPPYPSNQFNNLIVTTVLALLT